MNTSNLGKKFNNAFNKIPSIQKFAKRGSPSDIEIAE